MSNLGDRNLTSRLREHAKRVAGGGPSDRNFDPETLDLELAAAEEIDRLRRVLKDVLYDWEEGFKPQDVVSWPDAVAILAGKEPVK